jgi:sRNA-binding carbon storage regulator CsrA
MIETGKLSVTLKCGEDVILTLPDGREVTIYVQDTWHGSNGGKVRLSIAAPKDVQILRGELARKERP